MGKTICEVHAIAHPADQGCPYCSAPSMTKSVPMGPPADTRVIGLPPGCLSLKDQARLNLVQAYISLITAGCLPVARGQEVRGNQLLERAQNLGKKLGYPAIRTGMALHEALEPALAELCTILEIPG